MSMPGLSELVIIFFVLVLLFGSSKIPKLFGSFGEGIKNFKKGIKDDEGGLGKVDSGQRPNQEQVLASQAQQNKES